jgi:hypothetical protein
MSGVRGPLDSPGGDPHLAEGLESTPGAVWGAQLLSCRFRMHLGSRPGPCA